MVSKDDQKKGPPEGPEPTLDDNQIIAERRGKLKALRAKGNAYPNDFRRDALAGQSFATPKEIEQATRVATTQLNLRAKPWVWGRPPKTPRCHRRLFCYRI